MSDERKYAEREYVLAQRKAFVAGSNAENAAWMKLLSVNHTSGFDSIDASRKRYPLPKVTRPRVVNDPQELGLEYTVRNGILAHRQNGMKIGFWDAVAGSQIQPTAERCRVWADLLANPTEELECE